MISNCGGIGGGTWTPKSRDDLIILVFDSNGGFIDYRDGKQSRGTYRFNKSDTIYGDIRPVIEFHYYDWDSHRDYVYRFIGSDILILDDNCVDGISAIFGREGSVAPYHTTPEQDWLP